MNIKHLKYISLALFMALSVSLIPLFAQEIPVSNERTTKNQELFDYFSYPELVELSKTQNPTGSLKDKVDYILNHPIVDNTISSGSVDVSNNDPKIGNFIRVAEWNIDRGLNLDAIKMLFSNPDKLLAKVNTKDEDQIKKIKEQMDILRKSNVLILTEVDNGMPRTDYRNVVEELAKTLGYNYAYGTEFLEVDSTHLGLDDYKWSEERFLADAGIIKSYRIDKSKYRGLHGTAILSQFPLNNARILRLPKSYDWFKGENDRISELETLKRNVAEKIFSEDMLREVRHGSRMALLADINIPEFKDPVTIIAIHLENRTTPKNRKLQIETLLDYIDNIKNPIVLAGDFNTTCADGSPTGVKKEILKRIKDPNFVARTIILYGNPYGLAINAVSGTTSFFRKYTNPTVHSIPIVAPNPERGLFNELKGAEFADGHTFDFRGQKDKTSNGRKGYLANSNERTLKGFTSTFIFERPLIVGKYKLDWIFVKDYVKKSNDVKGSNKFAPHYARTLFDLNYTFARPLSDHVPITVDLPLKNYHNTSQQSKSKKNKKINSPKKTFGRK